MRIGGKAPDGGPILAVGICAMSALAAVALANKMARIAWKLMVTGENYAVTAAPAALAGAA
jgi:hypothetical protein